MPIDGQKCFFYVLVLDKELYQAGQEKLTKGEPLIGMDYLFSHQSVEIFEDSQIHVVH